MDLVLILSYILITFFCYFHLGLLSKFEESQSLSPTSLLHAVHVEESIPLEVIVLT